MSVPATNLASSRMSIQGKKKSGMIIYNQHGCHRTLLLSTTSNTYMECLPWRKPLSKDPRHFLLTCPSNGKPSLAFMNVISKGSELLDVITIKSSDTSDSTCLVDRGATVEPRHCGATVEPRHRGATVEPPWSHRGGVHL